MSASVSTTSPGSTHVYRMLGKAVRVHYELSPASIQLQSELALYPELPVDSDSDLVIRYRPIVFPQQGMCNPRIHLTWKNGMVAQYPSATVQIECDRTKLREISFFVKQPTSKLAQTVQRLRSIQYATSVEAIGQIFHELILIPSVYFDPNHFLLHAAAVTDQNGQVTLIGGTGGVGKTSLSVELCMRHGYRFLADDMSVVSSQGNVEPNLAFPKIYGYNLENDLDLQQRVLGGRATLDLFHWRLHARRGGNYVRRRMSPLELYKDYSNQGEQVRRYFIFVRAICDTINVRPIDSATAADLSMTVLETEQAAIHNQLLWHEYNAKADGQTPCVQLRQVIDNWRDCARAVFESVACSLVYIPMRLDHETLKKQLLPILTAS